MEKIGFQKKHVYLHNCIYLNFLNHYDMKTKLLCFSLLICCFIFSFGQNSSQSGTQKIFILSSYHDSFKWDIGLEKGYDPYLLNEKFEVYVAHLDTKRIFMDSKREEFLLDLYKKLYNNFKFDLILVTDDPALEFIKDNINELTFIKNVPIVACGINKPASEYYPVISQTSIINEIIEADETVLQIKAFFPDVKYIYIINDYTKTGIGWATDIKNQVKGISNQVKEINFIYNEDIPFDELIKQINLLPQNSAILVGSYFQDFDKKYFPSDELYNVIASKTNLPIFSLLSDIVNGNVLGGKMNSGEVQGDLLGKEAVRILSNSTSTPYIIEKNKDLTKWIFSYPALKKADLLDVKLPDNSTVLFKPQTFFERNSIYFKFLFLFTSLLMIVAVIIMIINIVLHRNVTIKTRELQNLIIKFEYFISEMPIGYIELNKNFEILKWNKSAVNIFGFHEDEVKGKNLLDFMVNKDKFENTKKIFADIQFNNSISQSTQIKSKTGKSIDCVWYITKYNIVEELSCYFCMVVDVSENLRLRKNLENMLKRSKELMQKNDMFIASTIHDLKNLLTPILSYSELMMLKNLPPEKMKSISEQLNKSANNLIQIFNDTLNNTKLLGTFKKFEPTEFIIHDIIQNILLLTQINFDQKNITVDNLIDPNQIVYADREMVNSIIMNLLHNAGKFTPENGKIVFFGKKIMEEYYEISIKDTGVGIDPDKIKDLFANNKYFTTKGTASETGTGLGLLLCNDLIMKNNGTIRAENNSDGPGAIFSFALPVKKIN
jgi:PAS domain S-box-containing protein